MPKIFDNIEESIKQRWRIRTKKTGHVIGLIGELGAGEVIAIGKSGHLVFSSYDAGKFLSGYLTVIKDF